MRTGKWENVEGVAAGGLKGALRRVQSGRQFAVCVRERSRFVMYKRSLPLHLLVYLGRPFLSFAFSTREFLTVSDLDRPKSFVGRDFSATKARPTG